MRRLVPILLIWLTALSLLVGLALGVLWVRSYWVSDLYDQQHPAADRRAVCSLLVSYPGLFPCPGPLVRGATATRFFQTVSQRVLLEVWIRYTRHTRSMLPLRQGALPLLLQRGGNQPVLRVDAIVLPLGATCGVLQSRQLLFEVAQMFPLMLGLLNAHLLQRVDLSGMQHSEKLPQHRLVGYWGL